MCGKLDFMLYGARDASHGWQNHYTEIFIGEGFTQGTSCAAVMMCEKHDARLMSHGDDFCLLADAETLDWFESILDKHFDYKKVGRLGPDAEDTKELVVLNRTLSYHDATANAKAELHIEGDRRHADIIVEQLGFSKAKVAVTPSLKKSEEEAFGASSSVKLSPAQATLFRSLTMRAMYLSQDRPDISEPCKSLARSMSSPTESSMRDLKRLGRYLAGHRRATCVFRAQSSPSCLLVEGDSDHAGCILTRRSTTGLAALYGDHLLKHGSWLQASISLSSGESEYGALIKAASTGLGLRSLFLDWNVDVPLVVASDSSAARGLVSRRGLGKARHIQTRFLWLQELVSRRELRVVSVPTLRNRADLFTKPHTAARIEFLAKLMSLKFLKLSDPVVEEWF